MYVEKDQWVLFIVSGIFLTVLINLGLAIRDIKSINQEPQIPQTVYKQLEVIPFTNEQ